MLTVRDRFERRQKRVRYRLRCGLSCRLRLSVHRSSKHIYAQIIDDHLSRTLVAASTLDPDFKSQNVKGYTVDAARCVGRLIAERALKKDIASVAFDRGGFKYHGRVQALAEAARERGLVF